MEKVVRVLVRQLHQQRLTGRHKLANLAPLVLLLIATQQSAPAHRPYGPTTASTPTVRGPAQSQDRTIRLFVNNFFRDESLTLPIEHPLNPASDWLRNCDGMRQMSFRFTAAKNSPVLAATAGNVIFAGYYGGYGKVVILKTDNQLSTLYAHLSKTLVSNDAKVTRGQEIGLVGLTGFAPKTAQPVLHFQVWTERQSGPTRNIIVRSDSPFTHTRTLKLPTAYLHR